MPRVLNRPFLGFPLYAWGIGVLVFGGVFFFIMRSRAKGTGQPKAATTVQPTVPVPYPIGNGFSPPPPTPIVPVNPPSPGGPPFSNGGPSVFSQWVPTLNQERVFTVTPEGEIRETWTDFLGGGQSRTQSGRFGSGLTPGSAVSGYTVGDNQIVMVEAPGGAITRYWWDAQSQNWYKGGYSGVGQFQAFTVDANQPVVTPTQQIASNFGQTINA